MDAGQRLGREGFVQFEHIDIGRIEPGPVQRLARRLDRAHAHDLRLQPGGGDRPDARQLGQAAPVGIILGADQRRRGPVGERRGGAGGDRAVLQEGRLEPVQGLDRGVRPDAAVLAHRAPVRRLDRDDLVGEAAVGARLRRLAVGRDGELLLALPGHLVALGHGLRGLAHGMVGLRPARHQPRIGRRVEAAHRHPCHALDPGGDIGRAGAEAQHPGGVVDRLH